MLSAKTRTRNNFGCHLQSVKSRGQNGRRRSDAGDDNMLVSADGDDSVLVSLRTLLVQAEPMAARSVPESTVCNMDMLTVFERKIGFL